MDFKKNIEKEFVDNLDKMKKIRGRSSFFGYENLVVDEENEEEKNRKETESYINKLEMEYKHWPENYSSIKKDFLQFWQKDSELSNDRSILDEDQQEFLAKEINVENYLQESRKFCTLAQEYALKKEWVLQKYQYSLELVQEKVTELGCKTKTNHNMRG